MGLSGINLATKTSQVGFFGKQTLSWKLAGCLLGSKLHTWAKRSPQNLSCPQGQAFQIVPTGYKEWPAPPCWDTEWEMLGQGHKLQIRSALEGLPVMPPLIQHSGVCLVCGLKYGPPKQRDLTAFRSPLMILENHLIFYSHCPKKKKKIS